LIDARRFRNMSGQIMLVCRNGKGRGLVQGAEQPSLTEALAARLARPVAAAARARARLHLLDWLGCVAGARREAVAAVARAAEPDPMTRAALMGNVLEMDDVDRIGRLHPGPVIWPVALCAGRDVQGSMAAVLDGGVRGYEAMVGVGRMFDDHHYAHWHPTATAGGFGAAAAAASVYGLDSAATVAALGNAGSVAGGLWRMRHEPVMTKAMHAAHAGLSALWFARLARAGFTGPARILEGEQGVFAAMTRSARAVPDTPGWRVFEVSFKPWAACRHAHSTIDAALILGNALAKGPIRVETYGDALRFCDRPNPVSAIEAKFSLQHAVAVVAVKGKPELADFEPEALQRFAEARARVTVALAEDLDAAYPAHFGARVTAGGQVALAADALGDPENPVERVALEAKLRALVAWGGLADAQADVAVALVLDDDEGAPVGPLLDLITRWTA
jgi:2-methylcitrate dehydratase PrpD